MDEVAVKRMLVILVAFYRARIDALEDENKKNKALIAWLEGFIDGKRFKG